MPGWAHLYVEMLKRSRNSNNDITPKSKRERTASPLKPVRNPPTTPPPYMLEINRKIQEEIDEVKKRLSMYESEVKLLRNVIKVQNDEIADLNLKIESISAVVTLVDNVDWMPKKWFFCKIDN